MPEILFIIVPAFIALICVLGYFSHLQEKQRREQLAAWAANRGWRFRSRRDSEWCKRYSQFSWFTSGHSRQAYNLSFGTLEISGEPLACAVGDYTYKQTSGTGKNRKTRTYHFSFVLIELPYLQLPRLAIRPEGFFDSISSLMGFDDIDFESEEFSRKFHVKSSDKRFAYDLIHPQMMEFMLGSPPLSFEVERGVFCMRGDRKRWETTDFDYHIAWCVRWLDLWPRHLLADLQSRSVR